MGVLLRVLALSVAFMISGPASTYAAPGAQSLPISPDVLFVEESEMPRGFVRTPEEDQSSTNPALVFSLRQYTDGSSILQQIVYVTGSEETARQVGLEFITQMAEQYDVEFGEILTIGDRAVSGWGEDDNGVGVNIVVFQRGPIAGSIVWIDAGGEDLEADNVALAAKMDQKVRAAIAQ